MDPAVKSTLSTKSFAVPSACKQSEIGATTRILYIGVENGRGFSPVSSGGSGEIWTKESPVQLSGFFGGRIYRFEFKSEKHIPTSVRKFHAVAVNHILERTQDIDHSAGVILAGTNTRPDGMYHVAY